MESASAPAPAFAIAKRRKMVICVCMLSMGFLAMLQQEDDEELEAELALLQLQSVSRVENMHSRDEFFDTIDQRCEQDPDRAIDAHSDFLRLSVDQLQQAVFGKLI